MKKILLYTYLSAFAFLGGINAFGQCEAQFIEEDGLLVAEMEEALMQPGWVFRNDLTPYGGGGFIEWKGGDSFSNPGNGTLTYKIKINNPGVYQFYWRSRVGAGNISTEHNDSWLKIADAADFYGYKKSNNDTVRPKGICTNDCPAGSGSKGWFKIYLSGTTSWTWSTRTSDHDAHDIYAKFDTAGVYTIEISGRSNAHLIDRFVLFNPEFINFDSATKLDSLSTMCPAYDYGTYEAEFTVKHASTLLAGVEVKLGNSTKITDDKGVVIFENLSRKYIDTLVINADGYQEKKEVINLLNNIEKTISLNLLEYSVHFSVTDGNSAIEGAEVKISTSTKTTNADGIAIFDGRIASTGVAYHVVMDGFVLFEGTFDVVDEDVFVNVELTPTLTNHYYLQPIELYPNPAEYSLQIKNHEIQRIEVYDMVGNLVDKFMVHQNRINVRSLHPGTYIVVLFGSQDERFVSKLVKL